MPENPKDAEEPGSDRTIFDPARRSSPDETPAETTNPPVSARTAIQAGEPAAPARPDTAPAPGSEGATVFVAATSSGSARPAAGSNTKRKTSRTPRAASQVAIGAVLNDIYEVKRLIEQGGMGAVYEGINVNTDERVAIKVILPHLAADPAIQALFRNEAQTLTKISHPALVQYRVLAKDAKLDAFYIVTEYIDGVPLADVVGKIHPGEAELRFLTRRLAEGLRAAHGDQTSSIKGVIHRDIAPDNIMLPQGRLEAAKVIDFGIAKDLDTTNKTIIGEGFAGKLGFVAPEQFGAYGREIGPWTDIYSLALVVLTLANGGSLGMGGDLSNAIQRRQEPIDLSALPESLRPVFERMLVADPKARLRSMDEVVASLDARPEASQKTSRRPAKVQKAPVDAGPKPPSRSLLFAGGAVMAAGLLAGLAFLALPHRSSGPMGPDTTVAATPATAPPATAAARPALLDAALGSAPCAWLEVESSSTVGGRQNITLTGAALVPSDARSSVEAALREKGVAADVRLGAVATLQAAACPTIEVFRRFRASPTTNGAWVRAAQPVFHIGSGDACNDPKKAQPVIFTTRPAGTADDISLLGLQRSGKIQTLVVGQRNFQMLAGEAPKLFDIRPDGLRANFCDDVVDHKGMVLVRGSNQAELASLGLPTIYQAEQTPNSAFADRFERLARKNGWRVQMAWFEVVPAGAP